MVYHYVKQSKSKREGTVRYRYRLLRSVRRSEEFGRYVTYGLRVCLGLGGQWRTVRLLADISTDARAVGALAEACTRGELHPMHLSDVVEDLFYA